VGSTMVRRMGNAIIAAVTGLLGVTVGAMLNAGAGAATGFAIKS
jgi:hypothetical protein